MQRLQTSSKIGVEAGVDERVERAVWTRRVVGETEEAVEPVRQLNAVYTTTSLVAVQYRLEDSLSYRRTPQVTQLFTYLLTHNLFSSCIRRYLVSRACDWVMPALSAVLFIFTFQFSLLFFNISLARPQPHQRYSVPLVLIRNIGHRTLPKIWVGTFLVRNVQLRGKTLNWF